MQTTVQNPTTSQEVEKLTSIVQNLVRCLIGQAAQHVSERLTAYMALPHQLNQMNADLIISGQLDVNDPIASEQHLWRQAKLFKNVSYIGFALNEGSNRESGGGRWINGVDLVVYQNQDCQGCDYATDEWGNRTRLIQSYEYAPLAQPYRQKVLALGKPVWTDIYTTHIDDVEVANAEETVPTTAFSNVGYKDYVAINAETPFYDKDGKLLGLTVVDLLLVDISQFLSTLKVSPAGQVFIVERDGMLVGSSGSDPILFKVEDETQRFSAFNTSDPMIRAVAEALQNRVSNFQAIQDDQQFEFFYDGQYQWVHVTPWQDEYGLDWLIIVSVPESDLIQ
jgi:hypothetical protein